MSHVNLQTCCGFHHLHQRTQEAGEGSSFMHQICIDGQETFFVEILTQKTLTVSECLFLPRALEFVILQMNS